MNAKFTQTQIAILVSLTLAVIVVFCIGGILIFSALLAASKPSEQAQMVEIGTTPQFATASLTVQTKETAQITNQKPLTVTTLPTATSNPVTL